MAAHLSITPHLTAADFDCPISNTFLGQAHIAGTGPQGTTCRECKLWGKKKTPQRRRWKYRREDRKSEAKQQETQRASRQAEGRLLPQTYPQQGKTAHTAPRIIVQIFRSERTANANHNRQGCMTKSSSRQRSIAASTFRKPIRQAAAVTIT